ncbi:hypothetical protein QVD17_41665 [Tagetes erecta]|uniref:DUF7365 domain-containing protein n=1 Tax=Tagetes erecta TaxID=13708 RepID=A0AAD8JMJ2_TARER|nr:hypothetical protein QVD17_41665 [Tagetes erecta]
MRGNWVSRDGNAYMAPVAEVEANLVEVQVGAHWPSPSTSRRSARIRVKYLGKRNADVKELLGKDVEEVMSKPKKARTENVQVSILGEPVERTLVTLVTRCAQYENQITTLKTKVGVLDEVDETTNERLKSYDEERVMQEHTLFQLNDRIRKLEEEMMEVKGKLQMTEQSLEDAEAGLVVTQQMVMDLEESNQLLSLLPHLD